MLRLSPIFRREDSETMNGLNKLKKNIPYPSRLKMAVTNRDYGIRARAGKEKKYSDADYSVECWNDTDCLKDPDTVGITVYYPSKESPTHMLTGVYSLDIGKVEFGKKVKALYKELYKKAGK